MKKLILLLITLTVFTNLSYASFPVSEVTKSKVVLSQSNPVMDVNRKILLLSLVPIPATFLFAFLFSLGGVGSFLGIIVGTIAVSSAVYSVCLNFKIPIFIWDWRNYIATLIPLVLTALALFLILVTIAFGLN